MIRSYNYDSSVFGVNAVGLVCMPVAQVVALVVDKCFHQTYNTLSAFMLSK